MNRLKKALAALTIGAAAAVPMALPAQALAVVSSGTCYLARDGGMKYCAERSGSPFHAQIHAYHSGNHLTRVWNVTTGNTIWSGYVAGGQTKDVAIPWFPSTHVIRISIDPPGCCTNAAFGWIISHN